MKKKSKVKRRRVSKEKVADNAREQASTGRMDWLALPQGFERWCPEHAGTVRMDILPYEVKSKTHTDPVEPGDLWYKRPFALHRNVGPDSKSIVCPTSVDSAAACAICAERNELKKDYDNNVDRIKELNPQKWVLYNMFDPKDSSKVVVFAFSRGKFAAALESELMEDEDYLSFYDVTEAGRTLTVRFVKDTYAGTEFIKASRIDFKERDEMDEDAIIDCVACLDDCLVVLSSDEIARLHAFNSVGSGDGEREARRDRPEPEEVDEPDEPAATPKARKKKKTRDPEPESESEPEDDDFPDDPREDVVEDVDADDADDALFAC